jgi:uncharacterized membrane protein YsdA (DUF1294 family)
MLRHASNTMQCSDDFNTMFSCYSSAQQHLHRRHECQLLVPGLARGSNGCWLRGSTSLFRKRTCGRGTVLMGSLVGQRCQSNQHDES